MNNATSFALNESDSSLTRPTLCQDGSTVGTSNKVKIVADYALQQKLGSGSFAVVYKGVRIPQSQSQIDVVAIKAISRTSDKLTKKVLQNLEIEINILRSYRHRNIVCMHDVQKTERHFYLILEFCAGGDVQKLIRTRRSSRLSERLTRRLMRDLASGLRFLWGQELIHRDIKPQNLLLTGLLPLDEMDDPAKTEEMEMKRREVNFPSDQFSLKIADFGFARHLQSASLAETLCGSPLYMAPEILQHHRYDAKADLWSVGPVLFEMITGQPPFHGENQFDLLRNIQRKAVRLPPDVRVSKECVALLRLLLNRNPLSRAGFKEFFDACDAFVALGCNGTASDDEGTYFRHSTGLVAIPEDGTSVTGTESVISSQAPLPHTQVQIHDKNVAATPVLSSTPQTIPFDSTSRSTLSRITKIPSLLAPLVPSPPSSSPSPIHNLPSLSGVHCSNKSTVTSQYDAGTNQSSRDALIEDNSFVMVEHSSMHKSSSGNALAYVSTAFEAHRTTQTLLEPPGPPSPSYLIPSNPLVSSRGDYMVVRQPKGMLSTSPGTGGVLMGLVTGRARIAQEDQVSRSTRQQITLRMTSATKMLAASEDVGRRAISVAHLGDQRAYAAMRLVIAHENVSSSLVSAIPMDGIEEEVDGTVTDDSTCADILVTGRRRRSSSATDKSMPDTKPEEEIEEMPFVLSAEGASPTFSSGMPCRVTGSKGASLTTSRSSLKPTPMTIRAHFSEALSCYLKSLKMLKGAIAASQNISKEFDDLSTYNLDSAQQSLIQRVQSRCEVTTAWLGGQFRGVLERADATNVEIGKFSAPVTDREVPALSSVEELIFNHALSYGRDGAVKQLLGQFDPARSCYRTAGLLAETLLMEPSIGEDDRKLLEDYVDGFAARINELDNYMLQQSRMAASGSASKHASVVSLIGQSQYER